MPQESEFRQTVDLPLMSRSAPVGSVDADARTLDVVFSTGSTVRRTRAIGFDTRIPYDETIIVSADAVNMERLNAGAPVLDSHENWTTLSQIGVVERAWIDGANAMARVRFPQEGIDPSADRLFALVSDGIVRNVSVGYSQDVVRIIAAEKRDDVERRIVERWTPYEISFVTIPADAGAQVRSEDARQDGTRLSPAVIISTSPKTRTKENGMPVASEIMPAAPAVTDPVTSPLPACPDLSAERQRSAEITDLATRHNLDAALMQRGIREGMTVEQFRAHAFDALAAQQPFASHIRVERDETETRRAAMEESLALRLGASGQPSEAARGYTDMSFVELAAERLGLRRFGSSYAAREEVLRSAMHTTSDFPILLENAVNRSLASSYQLALPTYREIAVREDFNDFRPHTTVSVGDFPLLQTISEAGDIRFGTVGEKKESVAVIPYAVGLSFTRQMMLNDSLSGLAAVIARYGQSVALFEEKTAYAVKSLNSGDGPTLLEGAAPMFTTGRTNKAGTATAITIAAVGLGRQAMRGYKSIPSGAPGDTGNELLFNAPAIILVGPAKETEAEQFVSTQIVPSARAEVNVFQGRLRPVVTPLISGNSWELYTDKSVRANFRWGLLNGYNVPRVRIDNPFGVQGTQMSVEHDFGFGAIDWRAGYRNAGA